MRPKFWSKQYPYARLKKLPHPSRVGHMHRDLSARHLYQGGKPVQPCDEPTFN